MIGLTTKSPWIRHSTTTNQILGWDDAEQATTKTVAIVHGYTQTEVDNNAALIAAAPDLYAALVELDNAMVEERCYRDRMGTWDVVTSALRKARGQ